MELAGYAPETKEVTQFQDQAKATTLQGQIDRYNAEIAQVQKDIEINPAGGKSENQMRGNPYNDSRQQRLNSLNQQKFKAEDELNKIPQVTFTEYEFNKKEDPRVTDAINKYGADSAQVKEIKDSIFQDEVYSADANADITRDYLDKVKKLVNGDYSYTEEQKKTTSKYFDPIKETLDKTSDMLLKEADDNQANLFDYVNQYAAQIDQTGYDTLDAMNAALIQVEKSGANLMSVVEGVNQKYENKAQFEFDLLSQKADEKAANQAALLGLPPGSMVEKKQAAAMKYNALQSVILDLEAKEADRTFAVAQDVESGKKQISLAKVDLALQQGGKKEGLANTTLGIAGQTGQQKMGIKGAYAQNLMGIENDKMNLLYNAAVGQLPQQVSGGAGYIGLGEQKQSSDIGQVGEASKSAYNTLNLETQKQMAQTTTTKTTTPSIFSTISAGVGALSGLSQGVMGGLGSLGIGKG